MSGLDYIIEEGAVIQITTSNLNSSIDERTSQKSTGIQKKRSQG